MGGQFGRARGVAVALAVGAGVTVAVPVGAPPAASADPPALPQPDSHGITVVNPDDKPAQVDLNGDGLFTGAEERMIDVTVTTAAIFDPEPGATPGISPVRIPIKVRIYLPANYQPGRPQPYPVLFLLHGGDGDYDDWSRPAASGGSGSGSGSGSGTDGGDIVSVIASQSAFDGIVVMPEGGDAGLYTDWEGYTTGHFRPQWESFHIDQLVPWVEANFNTADGPTGWSLAGLSMGGFGTLKYAATQPDVFSAIASFSAPTDLREDLFEAVIGRGLEDTGASVGANDVPADAYVFSGPAYQIPSTYQPTQTVIFGPPPWSDSNPAELAAAGGLDGYDGALYLYVGEGGLLDPAEAVARQMNDQLHETLADVDHRYCRGPGTHTWPYWREDLEDFLENAYGDGDPAGTCTDNPGWVEVDGDPSG